MLFAYICYVLSTFQEWPIPYAIATMSTSISHAEIPGELLDIKPSMYFHPIGSWHGMKMSLTNLSRVLSFLHSFF